MHRRDPSRDAARARARFGKRVPVSPFDRPSFQAVFEAHRDPVFRFLCRLTRSAADAEDLLQETFLTVWRKRAQFEGRGSAGGYLRRTAYRLYLNQREVRERRRALAPTIRADESLPAQDDDRARRESIEFLVRRVREALDSLPEPAREAFVLFRYEGLSCAQIAELVGAPVKTIESRLERATHLLAEKLRPYREHALHL